MHSATISAAPTGGDQVAHLPERAARRQHRVAHDDPSAAQILGQPVEVDDGPQRRLVPAESHVGHLGQRHDLLDRLHHAEAGAQDRHQEHDLGPHDGPGRPWPPACRP